MHRQPFDVIVAGAGPAGSTCTLFLSQAGKRVLLLDKSRFPRDKTCADNKTWLCTNIVRELGLEHAFNRLPKQRITRLLFSTPGGKGITVDLEKEKVASDGPHYNVRRKVFDNFLFQAAKKRACVTTLEKFCVHGVLEKGSQVVGVWGTDARGKRREFHAKVVVGADGSTSSVSTSVGIPPIIASRHASSARAYYAGVTHDAHTVELHYLKEVVPGYFWIFPVDKGWCNVGVGIPTQQVVARNIDLPLLLDAIVSSPRFSPRFARARRVSPVQEWGITIGGPRRRISGNGFVLIGDAANTSVTFGGEGVGPAMRSAKYAARAVIRAFELRDFSHRTLKYYDEELWRIRGPEHTATGFLEFLATRPKLFDWVVARASKSHQLKKLASEIASDYSNAGRILHPSTLLSLLRGS